MARRPTGIGRQADDPPLIRLTRADARTQLLSRIEIGKGILPSYVSSERVLEEARRKYFTWNDYNIELLTRMFTSKKYADEYSLYIGSLGAGPSLLSEKVRVLEKNIADKVRRLESVAERLDLIDEEATALSPQSRPALARPAPSLSNRIFLVHGRDEQMKESVARFLERLGFEAIILAEKPNRGRTVIEKFEEEADVGFAVVLLSPDDVGGLAGEPSGQQKRARQNVILELGYFAGRLGRERVCALKKGDLELPSDFVGVAYTNFGGDEGWKLKLAQELRTAEYEVDFNRI
jgi:predicted nucleotide-binding protein